MPITRAARANRANRTLLLNKIKFAFGSVVSEFLFPICVQKASSMKILLFCVINSSRHRKCFVRGFIHELFVSKALTRSYLARSGFDTNNSWTKPRTPHFLWRKLYLRYIHNTAIAKWGTKSWQTGKKKRHYTRMTVPALLNIALEKEGEKKKQKLGDRRPKGKLSVSR